MLHIALLFVLHTLRTVFYYLFIFTLNLHAHATFWVGAKLNVILLVLNLCNNYKVELKLAKYLCTWQRITRDLEKDKSLKIQVLDVCNGIFETGCPSVGTCVFSRLQHTMQTDFIKLNFTTISPRGLKPSLASSPFLWAIKRVSLARSLLSGTSFVCLARQ